ncbi:MAG TPA: hypothetical protein VN238_15740 [Solirubrobacteraceae bacterium]|nr:hypothetical protein [Solirubrobacteraceae bacterium]
MAARTDGEWWLEGRPATGEDEPEQRVATRLEPALPALLSRAAFFLAIAATVTAACVLLLDPDTSGLAVESLIGAAVWGALTFGTETRRSVPRGAVPPPPPHAALPERATARRPISDHAQLAAIVLVASAALVGLLALIGLEGFLFPGMFLGVATGNLAAAAAVAVWQRRHHRTVLHGTSPNERKQLYATLVPPRTNLP